MGRPRRPRNAAHVEPVIQRTSANVFNASRRKERIRAVWWSITALSEKRRNGSVWSATPIMCSEPASVFLAGWKALVSKSEAGFAKAPWCTQPRIQELRRVSGISKCAVWPSWIAK